MRIENNASQSLQGLSSNFIRLQKQRAAARGAGFGVQTQNFQPAAAQTKPTVAQEVQAKPAAAVAPAAQVSRAQAAATSRADSVQISPAASDAARLGAKPQISSVAAETAPAPVKAEPTISAANSTQASTPAFTQKDVEAFQGSFGKAKGDEGFNATYDLDGNGSINTLDLVRLLGQVR
ncbi:MAG: hypothetical protein ACKVZJ_04835 [Phycisphaerales bacterium]